MISKKMDAIEQQISRFNVPLSTPDRGSDVGYMSPLYKRPA